MESKVKYLTNLRFKQEIALRKKEGYCKLCLNYSTFVESHIYPKSFYKNPYNKEEKIGSVYSESLKRPEQRLRGIFDYFLCRKCEDRFNLWDDKAYKILYELKPKYKKVHGPSNESIKYLELDKGGKHDHIDMIKFFVLSLLWRASVCRRNEFDGVDLGPKLNQKARRAILKKSFKNFKGLDIAISKFENGVCGFIFPVKETFNGVNGYYLNFPFYTFIVKIDKQPFPDALKNISLNTTRSIIAINQNWLESTERLTMKKIISKDKIDYPIKRLRVRYN